MKKIFTLFSSIILLSQASAQSHYALNSLSQPYAPLSGAASANGSTVWHTAFFSMPLGFTAKIGNTTVNKVYTDGSVIYADTSGAAVDIFQLFFAHTIDRGSTGTVSKSPLLYTTTGTAPNRIFKFESRGGGFFVENDMYHTFADSFDCQFWLYETSNIVEIRFGNSRISHAADYFQGGEPSFTGYFNVNFNTGAGNIGYFAAGQVTTPYLDSFTATHMPALLSAYPASGTVYRFTPRNNLSAGNVLQPLSVKVYPTVCSDQLHIRYDENKSASYEILSVTGAATGVHSSLLPGINKTDVSNLPAGVYFLHLQAEGASSIYRFIRR